MNRMITAFAVEDRDGVPVPLMATDYRSIQRLEGFSGMATRQVSFPATGMNGRRNRTRYRDGRAGIVTGILHGRGDPTRAWMEYDAVARAVAASVATDRLATWTRGDGTALQTMVRLIDITPPLEVGPDLIRYQASFDIADPRAYSQDQQITTTTPLSPSAGGATFPLTFPLTFESGTGGVASVTNNGTVGTPPLLIFRGGLVDPVLTLDDDHAIVINGTIAVGEELYLYTAPERRALLNDSLNRVGLIDFAATHWFSIPPGTSVLRLTATSFSGSSPGVEIRTRHAYE